MSAPERTPWEILAAIGDALLPTPHDHERDVMPMTEQEWNIEHSEEAASQGWGLFDSDSRGLEIERDDDAGIFDSDEDALKYVERQAARGNACAVEALRLVAEAQAAKADEDEDDAANQVLTAIHAACNWPGGFSRAASAENLDGDEIRLFLDNDTTAVLSITREKDEDEDNGAACALAITQAREEQASTDRGIAALTTLPEPRSPEVEALIIEVKEMLRGAIYEDGATKVLQQDVEAVEAALKLIEPEWDEYTHGRDEPIDHTAAANWDEPIPDVRDVR